MSTGSIYGSFFDNASMVAQRHSTHVMSDASAEVRGGYPVSSYLPIAVAVATEMVACGQIQGRKLESNPFYSK